MASERQRLRTTFDSAADLYQQARPEYPERLYDTLIDTAGLEAGGRLVEIGCATGKATIPLARRGFHITCIEIGPKLAAAARHNLAGFPNVTIVQSAFETWRPPAGERFDLVFAATAWHWIDPTLRYQRAWELLRPGGHLALWSATHVVRDDGDRSSSTSKTSTTRSGKVCPRAPRGRVPGSFPTRSPATSLWRNGSVSASTQRSAGASNNDRMVAFAVTGELSSTLPAAQTRRPSHKPIPCSRIEKQSLTRLLSSSHPLA